MYEIPYKYITYLVNMYHLFKYICFVFACALCKLRLLILVQNDIFPQL